MASRSGNRGGLLAEREREEDTAIVRRWRDVVSDLDDRDGFIDALASHALDPRPGSTEWRSALACQASGELGEALRFARTAARRASDARASCAGTRTDIDSAEFFLEHCVTLVEELEEELCRLPYWYDPETFRDGAISLQLLQPRHARAFHRQARDPSISAMTRLPAFDSLASARRFVDVRSRATTDLVTSKRLDIAFAIVHRDRGLVGSLSLERREKSAFISYWIGRDHRGLGIARTAIRLVCTRASAKLSVETLFAAVFRRNEASLRALRCVGWRALPIRGETRGEAVEFLCWPAADGAPCAARDAEICAELERLLDAIDADFVFEAPTRRLHAP